MPIHDTSPTPTPALLDVVRRQFRRRARHAEILVRRAFGLTESEARLARDAQAYWSDVANDNLAGHAHWRGAGSFEDDGRWQALGRAQLEIFDRLAPAAGLAPGGPLGRVLDWGCGGGMNAIHFAPRAGRGYVGVDVARITLDRCVDQMGAIGLGSAFTPVLMEVVRPEAVLDLVPAGSCDLFLCLHVFELFPTPEYGLRVLGLAHAMLREGGAAFVQIRFDRGSVRTAPRRWGYARNLAGNTTYRAEAFWEAAQGVGFAPHAAFFLPEQPLNRQSNYAYFLMTKGPLGSAPTQSGGDARDGGETGHAV